MRERLTIALLGVGILFLAAFFRLYGFNWDQNQHLHPDERFLTMVAGATSWPQNLYDYLDTETSPLNPHNRGFGFFVYGTFPIFFTKWVAEIFKKGDYINLTLVGRQLSGLFDIGTVILVFLIAKNVIPTERKRVEGSLANARNSNKLRDSSTSLGMTIKNHWVFPLFSMFFYAASVLPIQLSHFFAVDTYLTFFLTLSFYLLVRIVNQSRKPAINTTILYSNVVFLGVAFGLALASKISALLFLPIIALGLIIFIIRNKNSFLFFVLCSLFFVSSCFTFRLAQPYLFANPDIFDFTLNEKVLDNWKQLKSFDGPNTGFPPALQWIPTKPYIYPFTHLMFWGLGLPIGITSLMALFYLLFTLVRKVFKRESVLNNNRQFIIILLSFIWIIFLFIYQGNQFPKALRYFYPLLPFLAITSGYFVNNVHVSIYSKFKLSSRYICLLILVSALFIVAYPVAFVSIYSRPHTRVSASTWIYKNLPKGSIIGSEHWDDPQPLNNTGGNPGDYKGVELTLYYPDSPEKWTKITENLEKTDYIAVTSNRLWRSLSALPQKYPQSGNYYKTLFDGSLGFDTIAVFSSYPCLIPKLLPSAGDKIIEKTSLRPYSISLTTTNYCFLTLNDDGAEESFTVYDHPKVIIFKNNKHFSADKLLNIITNTN